MNKFPLAPTPAEIFGRTCLESHPKTSPQTHQKSYPKFWKLPPFVWQNIMVQGASMNHVNKHKQPKPSYSMLRFLPEWKTLFVRPYMKYRVGPRIQFAVCSCYWKFQEHWLVDAVHEGVLIGQSQLGDTKPLLWQCRYCRMTYRAL